MHGTLRVLYAGNLGHLQDLETAILAADSVKDLPGFQLDIVGSGVVEKELHDLVEKRGINNVTFHGRVKSSAMSTYFERADFQLVPLKDLAIFRGTIPSKLQSSLSLGMPVISSVPGDVSELIVENGLGIVARPESVESLARAFRDAYSMCESERGEMGARAQVFYADHMSRQRGVDAIENLMASVVSAKGNIR
ncbi:hypothetical protein GCM10027416_08130 [Okibacterium endophyticum]